MKKMGLNLFRNWESKKNIVAPVIANLTTAFLVFLLFVLFKEPIYTFIKGGLTVEEFPLYCVAEPYNNEDGEVMSDFFIINLRGRSYTEKDLKDNLRKASPDQYIEVEPYIRIVWDRPLGKIEDITEDKNFNEKKGKIQIIPPEKENGEWIIRITEISPKGILKLTIFTDYSRNMSRVHKASIPFKYNYPGE